MVRELVDQCLNLGRKLRDAVVTAAKFLQATQEFLGQMVSLGDSQLERLV